MRTAGRLRRLREACAERGLDGMVVSSLPAIRYYCGFTGTNALLLVTRRAAWFVTDSRYAEQARLEVRGATRCIASGALAEAAARAGAFRRCRRMGIEEGEISVARRDSLLRAARGLRLRPTGRLVELLAAVKEQVELEAIAEATTITDLVYLSMLEDLRPGMTELDVAAEISYRQRGLGAERDAFDVIAAAGERAALPHARPTARRIKRGDLLLLDFGCVVRGYCSDMTRVVGVGRVPAALRAAHRVVCDAVHAATEALHDGVPGRDVDAAARGVITRAGYERAFPHSTGHGLGLRIHEAPRVAPRSEDVLATGMVTTIEPGIYLPGVGGVRVEDAVVVRRAGAEVLTRSPKELPIL